LKRCDDIYQPAVPLDTLVTICLDHSSISKHPTVCSLRLTPKRPELDAARLTYIHDLISPRRFGNNQELEILEPTAVSKDIGSTFKMDAAILEALLQLVLELEGVMPHFANPSGPACCFH
jgi:hypothetical protein